MTDLSPILDFSRSQAVLVGAWDYEHLTPVPAARNSLDRMEKTLTGPLCNWSAGHVHTIRNPGRKGELPDTLMDVFDGATDVALFYFVGHGQLHGDDLCLALRESPRAGARRTTTGLAFAEVRAALRESRAKMKIVILDCCFSGQATEAAHSLGGDGADVITMTGGTGAFTMAASGALNTAWFNTDKKASAPQTYFTEYLLDAMEKGVPGQPSGLSLGPWFTSAADALARDRKPVPTRSVRHDADRFIFARNAAAEQDARARAGSPASSPEVTTKRRRRRPASATQASDLGGSLVADASTEVDPDTIETLADFKAALQSRLPQSFPYAVLVLDRIGKRQPKFHMNDGGSVFGYSSEQTPELRKWELAWHRAWSRKAQARSKRMRISWRAVLLGFPVLPALFGLAAGQWATTRHFGVGNWIALAISVLSLVFVGAVIKVETLGMGGETRLAPVYREYEGWFVENPLQRLMGPLRALVMAGVFLLALFEGPKLGLTHVGDVALNWLTWRF